jgi:hypothetical protein
MADPTSDPFPALAAAITSYAEAGLRFQAAVQLNRLEIDLAEGSDDGGTQLSAARGMRFQLLQQRDDLDDMVVALNTIIEVIEQLGHNGETMV